VTGWLFERCTALARSSGIALLGSSTGLQEGGRISSGNLPFPLIADHQNLCHSLAMLGSLRSRTRFNGLRLRAAEGILPRAYYVQMRPAYAERQWEAARLGQLSRR
jgi:hypothetical protein